jgi:hypothetical protein
VLQTEAVEQLRRHTRLRQERDELKKAFEEAEKEYRASEDALYASLAENPIQGSVKVNLGEPYGTITFSPRETYFARIIDEDAAIEHYQQHGELDQMSNRKFAMKRVNEEVRDCLEQGKPLPPGVDYYARHGVTMTRQKN